MFIIYGRRTARIKRLTENHEHCKNCRSFGLTVKVYRDYYHLFYIPFFPAGRKTAYISCGSCNTPFQSDNLEKEYARITKTPVFLYTGLLIVASLILLALYANLQNQKEKAKVKCES